MNATYLLPASSCYINLPRLYSFTNLRTSKRPPGHRGTVTLLILERFRNASHGKVEIEPDVSARERHYLSSHSSVVDSGAHKPKHTRKDINDQALSALGAHRADRLFFNLRCACANPRVRGKGPRCQQASRHSADLGGQQRYYPHRCGPSNSPASVAPESRLPRRQYFSSRPRKELFSG